ncbi:MAG: cytochrome c oxidase assembly protein subunit 15 [Parvibaculaceae bacterium]|jgi:cytochrome c oxidase assembly protein subunit 15
MTDVTEQSLMSDQAGRSSVVQKPIAIWLFCICALVMLMVVVGGATRLTDSGLSITEWKPVTGALPPLSDAAWQEELAKYQQTPEYERVNHGMSLSEFKAIYWWEWGHRLLGRLIGIAFFVPFMWFWLRGKIARPLMPHLLGLFVLGGLQGLMGWYMVMSGLVDRVDVSQYRLTAHLGLAIAIFSYSFWLALGLVFPHEGKTGRSGVGFKLAALVAGLSFFQILLGGFVAGLHAGRIYTTWPLMDGAFIPDSLFFMEPWWLNLFESRLTVQFNHRMGAYLLLIAALVQVGWVLRSHRNIKALRITSLHVAGFVVLQAGLGIWTLLMAVPIGLGLMHQCGALLVLSAAIVHLHQCYKRGL